MIMSIEQSFSDPWIVPGPTKIESFGDVIPLTLVELSYEAIDIMSDQPDLID